MDPIGPISFQAARAYGVVAVSPIRAVGSGGSGSAVEGGQSVEAIRAGESGPLRLTHEGGGSKASPRVARLIAGVVPGKVDFSAGDARTDPQRGSAARPSSFALYHHPAEMNAAATGVGLGRMLDTSA